MTTKICKKCGKEYDISFFSPRKELRDGYENQCKSCFNKHQRERRINTNNGATRKYEKTINGFLMREYRNMQSRVTGVQKEKFHLYDGKSLLSREDFYSWAKSQVLFYKLFDIWEKSSYNRKLTPSVDRVNSSEGYELNNMEWVTHSENSRRGSINRNKMYNL